MSALQKRQQLTGPTSSPLVEAMVSGDRAGVGGILANDVNGLCLVSKGDMTPTRLISGECEITNTSNDTGVYTSLTRLASKLTPCQNNNGGNPLSPLITIEMEGPVSLLIKDYDGHTVAIKVPNVVIKSSSTEE